jgi:hypothetical protein
VLISCQACARWAECEAGQHLVQRTIGEPSCDGRGGGVLQDRRGDVGGEYLTRWTDPAGRGQRLPAGAGGDVEHGASANTPVQHLCNGCTALESARRSTY